MSIFDFGGPPPDSDDPPWPTNGGNYLVEFEVEYIGLYWDDTPKLTIKVAPEELTHIFGECDTEDLLDEADTPIASGRYSAVFTYWHQSCTDWETGSNDDDFGFSISELKFLSPFTEETKP